MPKETQGVTLGTEMAQACLPTSLGFPSHLSAVLFRSKARACTDTVIVITLPLLPSLSTAHCCLGAVVRPRRRTPQPSPVPKLRTSCLTGCKLSPARRKGDAQWDFTASFYLPAAPSSSSPAVGRRKCVRRESGGLPVPPTPSGPPAPARGGRLARPRQQHVSLSQVRSLFHLVFSLVQWGQWQTGFQVKGQCPVSTQAVPLLTVRM